MSRDNTRKILRYIAGIKIISRIYNIFSAADTALLNGQKRRTLITLTVADTALGLEACDRLITLEDTLFCLHLRLRFRRPMVLVL
jgi:hypothetical protein